MNEGLGVGRVWMSVFVQRREMRRNRLDTPRRQRADGAPSATGLLGRSPVSYHCTCRAGN